MAALRRQPEALPVRLENPETAAKHYPATMAGGVALFDCNDGENSSSSVPLHFGPGADGAVTLANLAPGRTVSVHEPP
jgi:hypothetical protein